jgi:predicted phage tail protein
MLRTVKVYGHLAEHCGQSVFEAMVRVPADAIKFLLCNFPELRGLMRDGYYKVAVGPHDLQLADCPEQIGYPLAVDDVVQVIPVVSGAGGGGVGKILAGAALIGLAIAAPGAGFVGMGFAKTGVATSLLAAPGFAAASAAAVIAGNVGIALALSGVAQIISPQLPSLPEFDNDPRRANNFGFSGIQQTAREGSTIPVVYGETLVGSIIISQGLNVDEVA